MFKKRELEFYQNFAKASRFYALKALVNAQSGHPGGSFSSMDFLTVLYLSRIAETNEKLIVSNGHISPAIYSILGLLGVVDLEDFVKNFRQSGSEFEGHVNRFVDGCFYSTGPLGSGFAAAAGMALAEKINKTNQKVFVTLGDGELQEGIVYETMHFASKYQLDNLICMVDYNQVQLSDSLAEIMPIKVKENFKAAGFEILECNGHSYNEIYETFKKTESQSKPIVIIMNTIMGYGSLLMQKDGENLKATWHGSPPKPEQAEKDLIHLNLNPNQNNKLKEYLDKLHIKISSSNISVPKLSISERREYTKDDFLDCRTAYGNALKDLGVKNSNVIALTADLGGSVKTNILQSEKPDQVFDVGIAEQAMVGIAGGLSLSGFIPFVSTFGVFMSSRARCQARLNDINLTNVKMVSTHCGISLGEDGPTHQSLDDFASMQALFNTTVIEPCDPNQTDAVIKYIANKEGNFYIRLGRHKYPVLLDHNQKPLFGKNYIFDESTPVKISDGKDLTVLTLGATSYEVQKACLESNYNVDLFLTPTLDSAASKQVFESLKKTKKLLVVQDHSPNSGLGTFLSQKLIENKINLDSIKILGVQEYQLSGKQKDLYKLNQLDSDGIKNQIDLLLS